jgi:hypothetical protein
MEVRCAPASAAFFARSADRERFRIDVADLVFDDHAGDVEEGPPFRFAARHQLSVGEVLVEIFADGEGRKTRQTVTLPTGYELLSDFDCDVVTVE